MKEKRVTATKKMKTGTITKPKAVIDYGEDLPVFSAFQMWVWRISIYQ